MSKICWSIFWSLLLAAIGVWASNVKWLAVALLVIGVLSLGLALALTEPFSVRVLRWRRPMIIAGFTILGGVLGFAGSKMALYYHDLEARQAEQERLEKEGLRTSLDAAQRELADARARAEGIENRRRRQQEKLMIVTSRLAEAIGSGDSIRYRFEDERRQNPTKFATEFERVHARAVETWRAETATMLDEELAGLGLGSAFSAITGLRVGHQDVYELSRLLGCIEELRTIQRNLPIHVDQIVQ